MWTGTIKNLKGIEISAPSWKVCQCVRACYKEHILRIAITFHSTADFTASNVVNAADSPHL
jgi:hypothetical protein